MLFVDNDDPELLKLHVIVEQGMGADNECRLTLRNAFQALAALPAFDRPGEEHHWQVERLQELLQGGEVLLGQNFRGSHESRLIAIGHGHEHGQKSHDGFATTDVALDETIHGVRPLHIVQDFEQHPMLRRSEVKR